MIWRYYTDAHNSVTGYHNPNHCPNRNQHILMVLEGEIGLSNQVRFYGCHCQAAMASVDRRTRSLTAHEVLAWQLE